MRRPTNPLYCTVALLISTQWQYFLQGGSALASEAVLDTGEVRREVPQVLAQLDSDRFHVRQQAAEQVEQWIARPELGRMLAEEFQRVLVAADTSLEVRKRLERWQRGLPKVDLAPAGAVSPEEIDRLVGQLEDDSYAVRAWATSRLEWLLCSPEAAWPIVARLDRRLDAEALPADARQWLDPISRRARAAWLASDPSRWRLPAVSEAEMAARLDALTRAEEGANVPGRSRRRDRALREIRDLLARDECVPRLKQLFEQKLAGPGLDEWARLRLTELVELTCPRMVAECWYGSQLSNIQHLEPGVPSQHPGAERPSHFDRIDDRVAHCVSGQNLAPGDYPVGVGIPHPNNPGAMFHLVNLPTPRRRMAYACLTEAVPSGARCRLVNLTLPRQHLTPPQQHVPYACVTLADERRHLSELSRRTFDQLLARHRPLTGRELLLAGQLDGEELSRFAGKYFAAVDDRPLAADDHFDLAGRPRLPAFGFLPQPVSTLDRPSHHGVLCGLLSARGTREAIPGLLEAIHRQRFLAPTGTGPRRLEWIAALAIARRDPWPGVDEWLAGLIERTERLVEYRPHGPELGATAAAILLGRFGQEPGRFELRPARQDVSPETDLEGFLFASPEARAKVRAWWGQRPEIRNPKSETNSKSQAQMFKT